PGVAGRSARPGPAPRGQRWYAWAWLGTASPRHYLLIRRQLTTGDLAFHYTCCPTQTPDSTTSALPPMPTESTPNAASATTSASSKRSDTPSPSNPQPEPVTSKPGSANAPPGAAARPLTHRFSDQQPAGGSSPSRRATCRYNSLLSHRQSADTHVAP